MIIPNPNFMNPVGISSRSIRQECWYKQIQTMMPNSTRLIDKLSISQILNMYHHGNFQCDRCGGMLNRNECDPTLEYHIMHMINPRIIWLCHSCLQDDIHDGRIIGSMPRDEYSPST